MYTMSKNDTMNAKLLMYVQDGEQEHSVEITLQPELQELIDQSAKMSLSSLYKTVQDDLNNMFEYGDRNRIDITTVPSVSRELINEYLTQSELSELPYQLKGNTLTLETGVSINLEELPAFIELKERTHQQSSDTLKQDTTFKQWCKKMDDFLHGRYKEAEAEEIEEVHDVSLDTNDCER